MHFATGLIFYPKSTKNIGVKISPEFIKEMLLQRCSYMFWRDAIFFVVPTFSLSKRAIRVWVSYSICRREEVNLSKRNILPHGKVWVQAMDVLILWSTVISTTVNKTVWRIFSTRICFGMWPWVEIYLKYNICF